MPPDPIADGVLLGDNNFLSEAFCLFMGGMDKTIGPEFEKRPAQLRAAAEVKQSQRRHQGAVDTELLTN